MKGLAALAALVMLLPVAAVPLACVTPGLPGTCTCGLPADGGAGPYFVPGDMTLEADGFHGERPLHAETWYYEALFDGWSTVFIVTLLSRPDGHTGVAMAGLYLYMDGHLAASERLLTTSFTASSSRPRITLEGTPVIEGHINREENLAYTVSFEHNGHAVDLQFVNRTKGWMGEMGRGWWLAVPELHVTGTVTLDGCSHAVEGGGYHDHNVFSLLNPLLERGYLDGKMTSNHFSLVWGHIMESRRCTHSFAILSQDGDYLAPGPDALHLSFSSHIWDNGSRIPTVCTVSVNDQANGVTGRLWMNATSVHHIRLPLLRYWRYHVEVTGWLRSPSRHEVISEHGMMEYMRY